MGDISLDVVRLLNRMIKERRFRVHPKVLSCLLHLRLKSELGGMRASVTTAERVHDRRSLPKGKAAQRRAKGRRTEQPHLSRKEQKIRKELDNINSELREAEAEVDVEERANRVGRSIFAQIRCGKRIEVLNCL